MTRRLRATAAGVLAAVAVGLSLSACDSSESGQTCSAPGPCYLGQGAIELSDDYSLALGVPESVDPRSLEGSVENPVVIGVDAAPEDDREAIAITAGSYGSLDRGGAMHMTVLLADGAVPMEIDVSHEFVDLCDQAEDGCTLVIVPEVMPSDLEGVSIRLEYEGATLEVRQ